MKKITSLFLVIAMLLSVGALASCSEKGFDYQNEDLSPYVTLINLVAGGLKADVAKLDAVITDEKVIEEINDALVEAGAYYTKITDTNEKVALGDLVGITYFGVEVDKLDAETYNEDGTKKDGTALTEDEVKALKALGFSGGATTSTVDYVVGLGAVPTSSSSSYSKYIDDLDQGLIGHSIGEKNAPIPCTFPEDYSSSDLAGKKVIFFTSFEYERPSVDPRKLDYGDLIAITYTVKFTDDMTEEQKAVWEEENGELSTEAVTETLILDKNNIFHAGIKVNFNPKMISAGEGEDATEVEDPDWVASNMIGVEIVFVSERIVTVKNDVEDEEGNSDVEVTDVEVDLEYTITVHKIATSRYFTVDDVKAGTLPYKPATVEGEEEEGETEEGDEHAGHDHEHEEEEDEGDGVDDTFTEFLDITATEYETFDKYYEGLKEDMQVARDIQIQANRYQAAFNALVDACSFASFTENKQLAKLKQKYVDEMNGNIDYLAQQYELLGLAETSARQYALSGYGYTEATLKTQLPVDAEEYVKNRLVFWSLVKQAGLTITDEEYEAGLANYRELADNETYGDGYDKEVIREALLWDKACDYLIENNFVTLTEKPAKEAE
ncbi:MAG: hypothetical protein IJ012_00900 [Clostridia bacterium]|nr:hypothetical protein [Clostridia bacterium]